MDIARRKQGLREDALARRAQWQAAAPDASAQMATNFLESIPLAPGAKVSAYIAIGDETDAAPLIERLRMRGHAILLPRVVAKKEPLAFHHFLHGARLVPGPFGLSQPAEDWPEADPDVLVVPLLAFDARGNRLGYGAGFYDRTLRGLRERGNVLAVGYALAAQEVGDVPHHDGDEKLDWIVTEIAAQRIER